MNPETKQWLFAGIKLWALCVTVGCMLLLVYIWVMAFLNGDSITIYINRDGERDLELVMWITLLPAILYGVAQLAGTQLRELVKAIHKLHRKRGIVEYL